MPSIATYEDLPDLIHHLLEAHHDFSIAFSFKKTGGDVSAAIIEVPIRELTPMRLGMLLNFLASKNYQTVNQAPNSLINSQHLVITLVVM